MTETGLATQVASTTSTVTAIVIASDDDLVRAGHISSGIAALRRQVDATFDPIIKKAHEAHKMAVAQKRGFTDPLEAAQRMVDRKIHVYQDELARKRREAEIARAAEEKRKAEAAAIEQAAALEQQGRADEAAAVVEEAIAAPPPVVTLPPPPKLEAQARRDVWRYRIVNPALIPREYLMPDEVKIGGVVRALKNQTAIPGVEVFSESVAIHR